MIAKWIFKIYTNTSNKSKEVDCRLSYLYLNPRKWIVDCHISISMQYLKREVLLVQDRIWAPQLFVLFQSYQNHYYKLLHYFVKLKTINKTILYLLILLVKFKFFIDYGFDFDFPI